MIKQALFYLLPLLACASCTIFDTKTADFRLDIEYIDKVTIADSLIFNNTIVGGLSSIDYLDDDKYVVISDDRSEYSPARFYRMRISFDTLGFQKYDIAETITLKNRHGERFGNNEIDPESVRYRVSSNTYLYTSEGGRTEEWLQPFVREMDASGNFVKEISIPEIFYFNNDKGLRENGGFESLTFENDTIIWYANELPLKEDGEAPAFKEGKYPIRLVRHDIKNDIVLQQYAYPISLVQDRPKPSDGFYINSVPEILFIEENEIWVMERSYSEGVGNTVKLFSINYSEATDVNDAPALRDLDYSPVPKQLILDFSQLNEKIDNIEGMTFGADFEDGSRSLLFISDNNFNETQETQLWLFKVKI